MKDIAVSKIDAKFILENFGQLPENTNFGVKANIVQAMLEANNLAVGMGSEKTLGEDALSSILSKSSYYVSCWMTRKQIEIMKTKRVIFSDLM